MCLSQFSKILIGDEKMILCRKSDLEKVKIEKIIKKAFPELLAGKNIFQRLFYRIDYKIECCFKMFSSHFDYHVRCFEAHNNWDENPFIALRVYEESGKTYCKAKPMNILLS